MFPAKEEKTRNKAARCPEETSLRLEAEEAMTGPASASGDLCLASV